MKKTMVSINFKHLHYFWMVAKTGSIAKASEELHITPQTISGQLSLLEDTHGVQLFDKVGRSLELSEIGSLVFNYANEIFQLGQELEQVLHQHPSERTMQLRVGVSDAVAKAVAYKILEPAIKMPDAIKINCREGKISDLMDELSKHKLDILITNTPIYPRDNVNAYCHPLGESGLSFFGTTNLLVQFPKPFPQCLDGAPFLLPSHDSALRSKLLQWFETTHLHPKIAGEFEDSALMCSFGHAGVGFFAQPSAISDVLSRQYDVTNIGDIQSITEQYFAISVQRKIPHPAILAISETVLTLSTN